MALRLQVERAEGLLVLGQILPQHIPQGLGLLRAEKDGLMVADGDLVGAFAGGQAEDQLEVPDADANLHAVGVGLAVVGGLDEIHLGCCADGLIVFPDYSAGAKTSVSLCMPAGSGDRYD